MLPADADLDLPRLRLLGLRDVQLEHAVRVDGGDRVVGDALGQADRAGERAEAALEPEVAAVLDLLLALALGRHGERRVVELDRDPVLGDAGQVERIDELVLRLPHVQRGHPALLRLAVALHETVHEPAHLGLKGGQLRPGLPTHQRCHRVAPFVLVLVVPVLDSMDRIKP